jgi:hypothetical protein
MRKGAMRLSEAIRLGAMATPRAVGRFFSKDGACALGAALHAIRVKKEGGARQSPKWREWSAWMSAVSVECPACSASQRAWAIIVHLNDVHGWPREEIGRWVATIEPTDTDDSPRPPSAARRSSFQRSR